MTVGVDELGAVADHAAPFEIFARVKTRRVDERDDRKVEGVTEVHEAGCFLRGRNVEGSCERHWLVSNNADRASID